jgi:hypothetical protein
MQDATTSANPSVAPPKPGFGGLTTPFDIQASYTISPDRCEASANLAGFELQLRADEWVWCRAFAFSVALGDIGDATVLTIDVEGGGVHTGKEAFQEAFKLRLALQLAGSVDLVDVTFRADGGYVGRFERKPPSASRLDGLLVVFGERVGVESPTAGYFHITAIDLALGPASP